MPKRIGPAMRERALNMVAEHRKDYPSRTAVCQTVADQLNGSAGYLPLAAKAHSTAPISSVTCSEAVSPLIPPVP